MAAREIFNPYRTPGLDMKQHYGMHQSMGVKAGGFIFFSGMYALDPSTGERLHGTVTSETRIILENLQSMLAHAGLSLDRLVQIHALIYDRIEYDVLNRIYRQFMPNPPPARTVWSVQLDAGFKIQIDAVAAA